ncbi:MAG: hypothetical protein HKO66_09050 [Saprospiraceae bacterium]|nr:hypothetical protein [Bacteroidia bacterium]NNE16657.1 hypothetical protein [Saprospiraceae bacterium]NNL92364.1 hypothetical protein [Saprospiraceae bacterium]
MNNLSKVILLFFIGIIYFSACGEYEALEIEKNARRSADSLFRAHRDSLVKMTDTICQNNHEKLFDQYFDSILNVELSKIEKLIEK